MIVSRSRTPSATNRRIPSDSPFIEGVTKKVVTPSSWNARTVSSALMPNDPASATLETEGPAGPSDARDAATACIAEA
jgi:hypothetical protein